MVPPLFVKLTVPVGVVATPGVVSVTVAVQLVGLPTGTEAGLQLTLVVVGCLVAVTAVVPALPSCVCLPPSASVMVCACAAAVASVLESPQDAELRVLL